MDLKNLKVKWFGSSVSFGRKTFGRQTFGRNKMKLVDQSTTSIDLPGSIDIYDASTKQYIDLMPVGQMSVSQMSVSQMSVRQMSVSQMSVS